MFHFSLTIQNSEHHINFRFFINHALHAKATFALAINGPISDEINDLLVKIEKKPNVLIIRRENTCYDIGTWPIAIKMAEDHFKTSFKRFILMNSSVRGPFFPCKLVL